jgi:hypothetical protein
MWRGHLANDDNEIETFQSVAIAVDVVGRDLERGTSVHICRDQRAGGRSVRICTVTLADKGKNKSPSIL